MIWYTVVSIRWCSLHKDVLFLLKLIMIIIKVISSINCRTDPAKKMLTDRKLQVFFGRTRVSASRPPSTDWVHRWSWDQDSYSCKQGGATGHHNCDGTKKAGGVSKWINMFHYIHGEYGPKNIPRDNWVHIHTVCKQQTFHIYFKVKQHERQWE